MARKRNLIRIGDEKYAEAIFQENEEVSYFIIPGDTEQKVIFRDDKIAHEFLHAWAHNAEVGQNIGSNTVIIVRSALALVVNSLLTAADIDVFLIQQGAIYRLKFEK